MIKAITLASVDTNTHKVSLTGMTNLPNTFINSNYLTPSEWFLAIENSLGANATYDEKRKVVANFLYKAIDIKKIGDIMAQTKTTDNKSTELKSLLPVQGDNGWWSNSLVYANGSTKEGGLIWKDGAKIKTQFLKLEEDGPVKTAWETWFKLSSASNDIDLDPEQDFKRGMQSFVIDGTWSQKKFMDSNKIDISKLYAFPLAQVSEKQMKHYLQGWNFGINARNQVGSTKYKATGDLLAEMFSYEIQNKYYKTVENYIPANMTNANKEKMLIGNQLIAAAMDILTTNKQTLTIDRSSIPDEYFIVNFDEIYKNILKPLKKNDSGRVVTQSYDKWDPGLFSYMKSKHFTI